MLDKQHFDCLPIDVEQLTLQSKYLPNKHVYKTDLYLAYLQSIPSHNPRLPPILHWHDRHLFLSAISKQILSNSHRNESCIVLYST